MKKIAVLLLLIIGVTAAFGNEISENELTEDFFLMKMGSAQISRTAAGFSLLGTAGVYGTLDTAFIACEFLSMFSRYSYFDFFSAFSGLFIVGINVCSIAFVGTLVPGIILTAIGMKKFFAIRDEISDDGYSMLLQKRIRAMGKWAVASGIVSAGAAAFVDMGIWLTLFGGGTAFGSCVNFVMFVIGGVVLSVSLPMFITAMAMRSWLKKENARVSLDFGFVSPKEDRNAFFQEAQKKTAICGDVALAVKIAF